ncbi:hypothetical protein IP90_00528 [Luteimonas cucumeris]|uniref:Uncharacterized protein n=1 Tax=Luteimonas cucumeris TaxID=985012 RepID=A0A562LF79_9GAMM|nr:hypothetical protein IP90_00528 [Luteimonas cucumeris]
MTVTMPAFHFHRDSLRWAFSPRKPRHPLLRIAFGLVGLALLVVLLVFGLFVGAAMVAAGLLLRVFRQRGKVVAADRNVVEGEYRVVGKPLLR